MEALCTDGATTEHHIKIRFTSTSARCLDMNNAGATLGSDLTGLTAARPPIEIVSMAQVVMGVGIGCRFAGAKLHEVGKALMHGAAPAGSAELKSIEADLPDYLRNAMGPPSDEADHDH